MIARTLTLEEYSKLGEEKAKLFSSFPPGHKVIVVEQDGEILGHWVLIPYWHVECLEISKSHQKRAGVARRLIRKMFEILQSYQIKTVMTASVDNEVTHYLNRLQAIELPGKHFVLPVGNGE